ncbi:MAG TPA: universal stress protein [Pseudomonadales bacterium]|nr:universal stress protein [Pseudomonadales bacterium]
MSGYKEVLVAVDLSDDLTGTLKAAVEKVATGANLSLVHVLEPAYYYYGMEPALGTLPPSFEEDLLKRAKQQLDDAGSRFGVPSARQYLERGHAPTQILRLAQDKGVDLIIVGSHGRHGWRLLLGSTANAVLHGARCDVLAVRAAAPA